MAKRCRIPLGQSVVIIRTNKTPAIRETGSFFSFAQSFGGMVMMGGGGALLAKENFV